MRNCLLVPLPPRSMVCEETTYKESLCVVPCGVHVPTYCVRMCEQNNVAVLKKKRARDYLRLHPPPSPPPPAEAAYKDLTTCVVKLVVCECAQTKSCGRDEDLCDVTSSSSSSSSRSHRAPWHVWMKTHMKMCCVWTSYVFVKTHCDWIDAKGKRCCGAGFVRNCLLLLILLILLQLHPLPPRSLVCACVCEATYKDLPCMMPHIICV